MFKYPSGFYVDVRIEESMHTRITFKKMDLHEQKIRKHKGAFVRLFDGNRWYYASTTNLNEIQKKIDELASIATPHAEINDHPIVKAFEVHQENMISYDQKDISSIELHEKQKLLHSFAQLFDHPIIVNYISTYVDQKMIKSIYSSKGSQIAFDKQSCGVLFRFELLDGENKEQASISKGVVFFDDLKTIASDIKKEIEKNIDFVKNAEAVVPGQYPVLLSPLATGVFTHESFGHKSESDFMVGDETMKAEWALGKKIGPSILTIIDNGQIPGNGYVPFDDEGTKGHKTYIITKGELTGRLHSASTAALLEEPVTANARAMNFEFEPIVRMTTTYIEKGEQSLEEIIQSMSHGIFVDTIKHGSGMSTFTIAPARAYMIENGKITKPVKISVVSGNVFETLAEIDAVSKEFELFGFVGGGCGKMEQFPLPVGFGGPYTRVKKLYVQ